jgi:hypothetical protein
MGSFLNLLHLSEEPGKLSTMYKFDIIVPAMGKRDALVAQLATSGVKYDYPVEDFVHRFEADPKTVTDSLLFAVSLPLAEEISEEEGMGVYGDRAEGIEALAAEDGTPLGWAVTVQQYDFYPEDFDE